MESFLLVRKYTRKLRGREETVLKAVIMEKPTMTVLKGCGSDCELVEVDVARKHGYNLYPLQDKRDEYNPFGQTVECLDKAYRDTVPVTFTGKRGWWDGTRLHLFEEE